MRLFLAFACIAAPVFGVSQVLSGAATANNGSGGIFMNLTPSSNNVTVTAFDTFFGTSGAFTVQVWTRPGTYVGNTASSAGWTLVDTVAGTSVNTTTLANFVLNNQLFLNAGQTTGVLLQATGTNNIRYNGTTALPPTTTWSNSDLTMFSAHARTGGVAFGGTEFTPRTFAGNAYYTVEAVPEPATMAVLGLGALALLRKRRKA